MFTWPAVVIRAGAPCGSDLDAIASLSPGQREAVERLAIREQTLAEASPESGRTIGALKVNFHRAIRALRERLMPREEPNDLSEGDRHV